MHTMVQAGADIIELGVPFSDPMADGPVIQRASERALEHNTSLHDVLAMVAGFRQQDADTPVVLMGYLNPIEVMGYGTLPGPLPLPVSMVYLTVDLPPEEAARAGCQSAPSSIDPIFLLAPTSTDDAYRTDLRCRQRFCLLCLGQGDHRGGPSGDAIGVRQARRDSQHYRSARWVSVLVSRMRKRPGPYRTVRRCGGCRQRLVKRCEQLALISQRLIAPAVPR